MAVVAALHQCQACSFPNCPPCPLMLSSLFFNIERIGYQSYPSSEGIERITWIGTCSTWWHFLELAFEQPMKTASHLSCLSDFASAEELVDVLTGELGSCRLCPRLWGKRPAEANMQRLSQKVIATTPRHKKATKFVQAHPVSTSSSIRFWKQCLIGIRIGFYPFLSVYPFPVTEGPNRMRS